MAFDPRIILGHQQYTGPDPHETMRTLSQLAQGRHSMGMQQEQMGLARERHALDVEQHQSQSRVHDAQAKKFAQDALAEAQKFVGNHFYGSDTPEKWSAAWSTLPEQVRVQVPQEFSDKLYSAVTGWAVPAEKRAQMEHDTRKTKDHQTWQEKRDAKAHAEAEKRTRILAGQKQAEREAGRQLPPSMLSELADFDTAEQQLEEIFQKAADEKISGAGAKANKFVTDLLDLQDTDAARFEGASAPVRQGVGTILEKGKLAAGDEGKYKNMLPRYGDSPSVLAEKKKALKSYLATLKAKRVKALDAGRYAVPGGKSAPRSRVIGGKTYTQTADGQWEVDE